MKIFFRASINNSAESESESESKKQVKSDQISNKVKNKVKEAYIWLGLRPVLKPESDKLEIKSQSALSLEFPKLLFFC